MRCRVTGQSWNADGAELFKMACGVLIVAQDLNYCPHCGRRVKVRRR